MFVSTPFVLSDDVMRFFYLDAETSRHKKGNGPARHLEEKIMEFYLSQTKQIIYSVYVRAYYYHYCTIKTELPQTGKSSLFIQAMAPPTGQLIKHFQKKILTFALKMLLVINQK